MTGRAPPPPPSMLSLVHFLHSGMKASVRVNGRISEKIAVNNELHQGCTLDQTLFNLYFATVMSHWHSWCPEEGVDVLYKLDRRLVGDRTAKSRLSSSRIAESQFADDIALHSLSRESFEKALTSVIICASEWGLMVSLTKMKGLVVVGGDGSGVNMHGGVVEVVEKFTYLGSILHRSVGVDADVKSRIAKATRVFDFLLNPVFNNLTSHYN